VEQLIGGLDHDAAVARQVAGAQDRESVVGERRRHVRTVRSAAWSRNRPRRRVAWLLLVILLVLIALVARVDAAPGGAPIDLAIRHADGVTGADGAGALDEDGDEEAEDRAAERAEIDDNADGGEDEGEEEGAIDDRGPSANGELAGPSGELSRVGEALAGERGDAGAQASLALDDGAGDPASLALGGDDAGAPASLALGEDDAGAPASLALGEDDARAGSAGAGAVAMLDAELAPGDTTAVFDAADADATAGAQEVYEQWMRHRRPSPWGRLDVGVSWRRRWSAPIHAPAYRHDEIWLVATWRR
jgi:hypothetical protein